MKSWEMSEDFTALGWSLKIVFVIADIVCVCFQMKLSVVNGHLPNMQDASVVNPSQDLSKPRNVSPTEKQQKAQVK